ncbi:hypothetical protein [Nostoc sp. FACHB-280]|nr:hypothetical protein [Nostoc sp. FACHB-280]
MSPMQNILYIPTSANNFRLRHLVSSTLMNRTFQTDNRILTLYQLMQLT